jgi:periplasmic protein TonB
MTMQVTFDPDIDQPESVNRLWIKRIAIALAALLVLGAIGYGVKSLMSGSGAPQKKQKTTIKLLPDTPPPPPPPPKEPPKEQPKPDAPKEIKVEQPKPAEAPPAENIKMEGPAGDGPSPFQAGAVNNDYKGGDVSTKIGGDGGAKFSWYAGVLKSQIEDILDKNKEKISGKYKIIVTVWVSPSGKVDKLDLSGGDVSPDVEKAVKNVLENMPPIREQMPESMPQPIKLRITSR